MHDFTEILLKWFPRLKFRHFHNTEMCQRNIQFHVKSAKQKNWWISTLCIYLSPTTIWMNQVPMKDYLGLDYYKG